MSSYTVEAVLKASGVSQFQQAFANAEQSMKGFKEIGAKMGDVGKSLTKGITLPVMALGAGVMKVGKDYEASMSQVAAISGATGDELDKLKDTAREMGATTRYSASESADALGFMALAGWDVEQMTSALPGVLDLATAGAMDLATASDIVTDTMSMFGMEAKDAGKASDIFAAAQSKSNTNVEQLSEALLNAGPAAAAAGADLEQTSAILGVFANQGVKGGRAGTTLNAMFRDLKNSTEDGAVAIGEHSIAVYDASGNMRAMGDIMADVENATKDMTTEQRDSALADVFKQQSLSGVNLLLAEGSDALKGLENDIYNSEGAASDMAEIMDDNLSGALANMKSALEEVALGFYDMSGGPMTELIQKVTELFQWFGNLSEETKQWIMIIGLATAAIGPILIIGSKLIAGIATLSSVLVALVNPVTLVVGAIAGAILILKHFYETNETVREVVDAVWNKIKSIISTVINAVSGVVTSVWETLTSFWVENNELIKNTATTVWNAIQAIVTTVINVIKPIVIGAWNAISTVTSGVWNTIKTVISGAMNAILGTIKTIMQIITGDWRGAWNTMKSTVSGVINSVKKIILSIGNISLFSAGKAIIDGFVKGLKGAWDAGKKFVSGIGGWIKKNKGPISYDKRLLRPAGDAIIGGLNKGLQDSFPDVQRTVSGMAGSIQDSFTSNPTMAINGNIARSNGQIQSAVSHEINRNQNNTQPAYINVNIGGQNFRGFVENISSEQGRITDLELQF